MSKSSFFSIKDNILGAFQVGADSLAGVRPKEAAAALGINYNTYRRAVGELAKEGYLVRTGRGTYEDSGLQEEEVLGVNRYIFHIAAYCGGKACQRTITRFTRNDNEKEVRDEMERVAEESFDGAFKEVRRNFEFEQRYTFDEFKELGVELDEDYIEEEEKDDTL